MTLQPLVIHAFLSFTLAILMLFVGKGLVMHYALLRRFSIPEPVIGGFVAAVMVGLWYSLSGREIAFDLKVMDVLILYFFGAIGLKTDIGSLLRGGKPLLILLVLTALFACLQNLVGISLAPLFGQPPQAGMVTGSIALTGGIGTTLAWAPTLAADYGVSNANELGVAANTIGLIASCLIGGPIASYLIRRHRVSPSGNTELDVGISHSRPNQQIDAYGVLWAWFILNCTLIIAHFINEGLLAFGIQMPMLVSALIGGILINNLTAPLKRKRGGEWLWPGTHQGLALLSDIALGMFLTMALMGLKLWALQPVILFVGTLLAVQVTLVVLFVVLVLFRALGSNYDAAVVCAGFGGVVLGSTATAIVSMNAVTKEHGSSHQAMIIVPLVSGFLINLVNAFIIEHFLRL
ncbi:MAG: sodium/glutamate symporter [Gammaproteobacteria bacterium]|nr:sodium/glutamate symporter [Gammaproteobacteria bacterium]